MVQVPPVLCKNFCQQCHTPRCVLRAVVALTSLVSTVYRGVCFPRDMLIWDWACWPICVGNVQLHHTGNWNRGRPDCVCVCARVCMRACVLLCVRLFARVRFLCRHACRPLCAYRCAGVRAAGAGFAALHSAVSSTGMGAAAPD